jgi:hypothetical protein
MVVLFLINSKSGSISQANINLKFIHYSCDVETGNNFERVVKNM